MFALNVRNNLCDTCVIHGRQNGQKQHLRGKSCQKRGGTKVVFAENMQKTCGEHDVFYFKYIEMYTIVLMDTWFPSKLPPEISQYCAEISLGWRVYLVQAECAPISP